MIQISLRGSELAQGRERNRRRRKEGNFVPRHYVQNGLVTAQKSFQNVLNCVIRPPHWRKRALRGRKKRVTCGRSSRTGPTRFPGLRKRTCRLERNAGISLWIFLPNSNS